MRIILMILTLGLSEYRKANRLSLLVAAEVAERRRLEREIDGYEVDKERLEADKETLAERWHKAEHKLRASTTMLTRMNETNAELLELVEKKSRQLAAAKGQITKMKGKAND